MTKKTVSLLTVLTTLNIMMLPAFANPMGDAIVAGFQANTEKKIEKANAAKDYSGELTFMNNHLKLDKAFTKRYNELQPNEVGSCNVGTLSDVCPDGYKLTAETTKKSNRENIEYWENQMMRANTLSALGTIYACATTAYKECHYIGGAGGIAKTVNGGAKFISKVAEFFGKDAIVEKDFDIREGIVETNVSGDDACKAAMESSSATTTEYLAKLRNCEHIDQVTLSGYTEEDIQNLLDDYESKKENANSKANRLLTSLSMAATGVGGMELAQGLSEQKADKAADADMTAYISTMRCSYGNGKSVKAGADEIELPGGNDANLMKYRSEYTALANDLKERKTALNMTPGIESEEILDKSQMGLYDDENVGITAGNYASRYRAQMLGSESDQTQLDEAAQTSKTRVIGGAVAAGAGVVGGIVGDELINQSLSSSTKTAQTCTESGGTWQGGRCHCPDGYIQHTKTGPCFEEQPTETAENPTPPQDNNTNLSNTDGGNNDNNSAQPGADDSTTDTDDSNPSQNIDVSSIDFDEDLIEEEASELPDEVVLYEQERLCRVFDGNWKQGKCLCTDEFQKDNGHINCVNSVEETAPSTRTAAVAGAGAGAATTGSSTPQAKTGSSAAAVGTVADKTEANSYTTKQDINSNPSDNSNNQNSNKNSQNTQNQQNNLEPDVLNDSACETEGPDYQNNCVCTGGKVNPQDGSCSCPNNQEPNAKGSCPKSDNQQRQVIPRQQQKSTPSRANTTNGRTTNNNDLSKQDMSKNGTFAKAYNADGTCDIERNEYWEVVKSASWCDDLYKGEWKVQFDYGLVRGESKCSNTKGKYNSAGSPSNTNGQYCWCKVKTYKPTGGSISNIASPSWVSSLDEGSASDCARVCADSCAIGVGDDDGFRRAVFGVAGK